MAATSESGIMHTGPKRLILVLGGARSGKSSYAEALAARMAGGEPVTYVATATADDEEMRERIARHRAARPVMWRTLETPDDPAAALASTGDADTSGVILLDCLTLLASNVLLGGPHTDFNADQFDAQAAEQRMAQTIDALLSEYRRGERSMVLVSNEVGMGLVPPYPLGRAYRDALGRVNARVAAEADAVLLMIAGLPVEIKALSAAWHDAAVRLFGL